MVKKVPRITIAKAAEMWRCVRQLLVRNALTCEIWGSEPLKSCDECGELYCNLRYEIYPFDSETTDSR
jgi:hypothetical protein